MSVFGRTTFSAAGYAASRPSYPASLFQTVLARHGDGPKNFLLDLGCGHGLVARAMSRHFDRVLGVDMSAGMIRQAASTTDEANVSFRQGGAEDLSFVPGGSVDMVVAAQAAHWFDFARAWPELARVVRPRGSLAFWGYKDNVLIGHQQANKIMEHFCYGRDEVAPGVCSMARYWEQPGRERLRNLLRDVEPPPSDWQDVQRLLYDVRGDVEEATVDAERAWMRKRIRLGELEAYLRTFSAFQGWCDDHPQAMSRKESGGDGDLVDMMMERIVACEPEWTAMGERWREAEVETVWGTCIVLATRRTG